MPRQSETSTLRFKAYFVFYNSFKHHQQTNKMMMVMMKSLRSEAAVRSDGLDLLPHGSRYLCLCCQMAAWTDCGWCLPLIRFWSPQTPWWERRAVDMTSCVDLMILKVKSPAHSPPSLCWLCVVVPVSSVLLCCELQHELICCVCCFLYLQVCCCYLQVCCCYLQVCMSFMLSQRLQRT